MLIYIFAILSILTIIHVSGLQLVLTICDCVTRLLVMLLQTFHNGQTCYIHVLLSTDSHIFTIGEILMQRDQEVNLHEIPAS